jgi:apolipoprotein D and lipocalin family protein
MRLWLSTTLAVLLAGCQTTPLPPIETVARVDLARFMGDWYVIAHIPTYPERKAWNAVESYALNADGSIATTFTFNEGGYDGPLRTMRPTGFVVDRVSNATWGMQFIWPIKADYRITYFTPDYDITVIARAKRDYVWVMARRPTLSAPERAAVDAHLVALGYDLGKLREVPHRPRGEP